MGDVNALLSRKCRLLFGRVCRPQYHDDRRQDTNDTDTMLLDGFHSFNWLNCQVAGVAQSVW
jgi:hypothetical protein